MACSTRLASTRPCRPSMLAFRLSFRLPYSPCRFSLTFAGISPLPSRSRRSATMCTGFRTASRVSLMLWITLPKSPGCLEASARIASLPSTAAWLSLLASATRASMAKPWAARLWSAASRPLPWPGARYRAAAGSPAAIRSASAPSRAGSAPSSLRSCQAITTPMPTARTRATRSPAAARGLKAPAEALAPRKPSTAAKPKPRPRRRFNPRCWWGCMRYSKWDGWAGLPICTLRWLRALSRISSNSLFTVPIRPVPPFHPRTGRGSHPEG